MVGLRTQSEPMIVAGSKVLLVTVVEFSKKAVFKVVLDVFLIGFAYWSAYAIKFEAFSGGPPWSLFERTLLVVVVARLVMFVIFGVYRSIWRYTSADDLVIFVVPVLPVLRQDNRLVC